MTLAKHFSETLVINFSNLTAVPRRVGGDSILPGVAGWYWVGEITPDILIRVATSRKAHKNFPVMGALFAENCTKKYMSPVALCTDIFVSEIKYNYYI